MNPYRIAGEVRLAKPDVVIRDDARVLPLALLVLGGSRLVAAWMICERGGAEVALASLMLVVGTVVGIARIGATRVRFHCR